MTTLRTLLGAAASADDCTPRHSFETVTAGQLPPYSIFRDAKIIKEIAAMECLELDLFTAGSVRLIQRITSGQADPRSPRCHGSRLRGGAGSPGNQSAPGSAI